MSRVHINKDYQGLICSSVEHRVFGKLFHYKKSPGNHLFSNRGSNENGI